MSPLLGNREKLCSTIDIYIACHHIITFLGANNCPIYENSFLHHLASNLKQRLVTTYMVAENCIMTDCAGLENKLGLAPDGYILQKGMRGNHLYLEVLGMCKKKKVRFFSSSYLDCLKC